MDPSTLSAVAACLAAGAAWYANMAYAGRERREWQRTTVVKAAAEVRDSYALWHWAEDHRMNNPGDRFNTAEELLALENELSVLTNRTGLAKAQLNSVGATALAEIAESAWGDQLMVLYELGEFRRGHPDGGIYDGYRVCSLERHGYRESELDEAMRAYATTRTQRVRGAIANVRKLPTFDKALLGCIALSCAVFIACVVVVVTAWT